MFFTKWKRRFRHFAHSRIVFCSSDMLLCTAVMIVIIMMVSSFVMFQDAGACGMCVQPNAQAAHTMPSSISTTEAPVTHAEKEGNEKLLGKGHVASKMIKVPRKYPIHYDVIPVGYRRHADEPYGNRRTNPLSPKDIAHFEEEQSIRQQRMRATCRRYDLDRHDSDDSLHRLNAWEYLIDRKHKIIWCTIFKAASSSWFYTFNQLAGYSRSFLAISRKTPVELARRKFPRPNEEQLRNALGDSISFLVVREPFERLLSAYRDKYEFTRYNFYRNISRTIIKRYRTTVPPSMQKSSETIEKPTDEKRGSLSRYISKMHPGPTFAEFVRYVVDTAKNNRTFDEHWTPYYRFCTPCLLNLTVIAHLETNPLDNDYILHRAQLEGLATQRPKINQAKGAATHDVVKKYYGQLDLPLLQELYSIYHIDFEMFGYNATKYFNMVKRLST